MTVLFFFLIACTGIKDDPVVDTGSDPPANPCGAELAGPAATTDPAYTYSDGFYLKQPDIEACDGDDWRFYAYGYSDEAIEADAISIQIWDGLTAEMVGEHPMTPPADGEIEWWITLTAAQVGLPCGTPGRAFTAQPSLNGEWGVPQGGRTEVSAGGSCIRSVPADGEEEFSVGCSFDVPVDSVWVWFYFPITKDAVGPFFLEKDDEYDSWGRDFHYTNDAIPRSAWGPTIGLNGCFNSLVIESRAF